MTSAQHTLRRGLPRTSGGQPWPLVLGDVSAVGETPVQAPAPIAPEPLVTQTEAATAVHAAAAALATTPAALTRADGIRRGLPRIAGGTPWPAAVASPLAASAAELAERAAQDPAPIAAEPEVAAAPSVAPVTVPLEAGLVAEATPAPASVSPAVGQPSALAQTQAPVAVAPPAATTTSATTASATTASSTAAAENPVAALSRSQRTGVAIVCAFALFGLASAVVLAARWLVGLDPVAAFVTRFPGEYELPHAAPEGLPAWLGWQHFFNLFFLVLIVRSGLQVRQQQRPPAYWASRRNPQQKISINLWLHQSLDVLWLTNGIVFVILLFATGQWMRIVPTSWEVFPNALSAGLQYLTLNWPVENGWINYNGLQQLAYFATVFIAAPLAVASGVRLSGFWPKDNAKLSAAYPIEVARALHFPVMLYFVGFTVIHVTLVLTTGALRNLNHMYGARDEVSWFGAIMLLVSLTVIAVSVLAARPMVLAPIARMMGNVSAR